MHTPQNSTHKRRVQRYNARFIVRKYTQNMYTKTGKNKMKKKKKLLERNINIFYLFR